MKKKYLGKFLGLALAAVLAIASSVPTVAAENVAEFVSEDVAYEEVLEEITEETIEESEVVEAEEEESEAAEEATEEETEEAEEAEEFFEEETEEVAEEAAEEAVETEVAPEAVEVTESQEETVLTEETEQPVETPAEEPVDEPAEEPVKKDSYAIEYDLDGGKLSKNVVSYKPGKKVTLPKAKKTGYNFLGWVPADENVDDVEMKKVKNADGEEASMAIAIKKTAKADIYLTAVFEPIRFKLYLDPNGKGVKDGDKELKKKQFVGIFDYEGNVVKEGDYEPGNPEKRGSVLVGFSLNKKAKTEEQLINEGDLAALTTKSTATLYCIWEKIPYKLNYLNEIAVVDMTNKELPFAYSCIDNKADEIYKSETIFFGSTYKLKNIAAPGCTFVGWKVVDSEGASFVADKEGLITKVKADNEKDIYVQGIYVENYCTVKFNTNGGTYGDKKAKGNIDIMKGDAKPVTQPEELFNAMMTFAEDVNNEGYVLKGLALDKKGKKMILDASMFEGNEFDEEAFAYSIRSISKKLNSKVTVYAVWEKAKK